MSRSTRAESSAPEPFVFKLFDPSEHSAAEQKLRKFFHSWYLPNVLIKERDADPKTVANYEVSLDWWERLTDDPDVGEITRDTLTDLKVALRTATFRRGKLKTSPEYPLSKERQKLILRNLRAIIYRTGPDVDPERPAAGIVEKVAHVRLEKSTPKLKPAFSLNRVRRLIAVAQEMTWPEIDGVDPGDYCVALLCGLFYTGLRVGTLLTLQRPMLQVYEDGPWIEALSQKTDKTARIAVHNDLARALAAIQTSSKFLFSIDRYQTRKRRRGDKQKPWLSVDRVADLQEELQRRLKIPEAQWLSPHVWRRTHLNQLEELGYGKARALVQAAADHGDADTTEGHYVDVTNKFRRRLPSIVPEIIDDRQKLLF